MPRDRNLSADLWTRERLVACRFVTRLLFVAMQNFADDHGVQPCSPYSIRLQIFPGDAQIDDAKVRAMLEELVTHKLARIYEVDGLEYIRLLDWARMQRVPKRPRLKYPRDPSLPEPVPPRTPPLPKPVPANALELAPPAEPAPPAVPESTAPEPATMGQPQRWRRIIKNLLRQYWPRHPLIELMDDDAADRWAAKWIAQGCDFQRDIIPVVRNYCRMKPFCGPPVGFQEIDEQVGWHIALREERQHEVHAFQNAVRDLERRHELLLCPE